jgi:hypothetical protein
VGFTVAPLRGFLHLRSLQTLVRRLTSEVGGPRSNVRGPKSEVRSLTSEARSLKFEVRGPRSEVRGLTSELPLQLQCIDDSRLT